VDSRHKGHKSHQKSKGHEDRKGRKQDKLRDAERDRRAMLHNRASGEILKKKEQEHKTKNREIVEIRAVMQDLERKLAGMFCVCIESSLCFSLQMRRSSWPSKQHRYVLIVCLQRLTL